MNKNLSSYNQSIKDYSNSYTSYSKQNNNILPKNMLDFAPIPVIAEFDQDGELDFLAELNNIQNGEEQEIDQIKTELKEKQQKIDILADKLSSTELQLQVTVERNEFSQQITQQKINNLEEKLSNSEKKLTYSERKLNAVITQKKQSVKEQQQKIVSLQFLEDKSPVQPKQRESSFRSQSSFRSSFRSERQHNSQQQQLKLTLQHKELSLIQKNKQIEQLLESMKRKEQIIDKKEDKIKNLVIVQQEMKRILQEKELNKAYSSNNLQKQINSFEEQIFVFNGIIKQKELMLKEKQDEILNLYRKNKNKTETINEMKSKIRDFEAQTASLFSRQKELDGFLQQKELKLYEKTKEIEQLQGRNGIVRVKTGSKETQEISKIFGKVQKLQISNLKENIQSLTKDNKQFKQKLKQIEDENLTLQKQRDLQLIKHEEQQQEIARLSKQKQQISDECEQMTKEFQNSEKKLEGNAEKMHVLNLNNQKIKSGIQVNLLRLLAAQDELKETQFKLYKERKHLKILQDKHKKQLNEKTNIIKQLKTSHLQLKADGQTSKQNILQLEDRLKLIQLKLEKERETQEDQKRQNVSIIEEKEQQISQLQIKEKMLIQKQDFGEKLWKQQNDKIGKLNSQLDKSKRRNDDLQKELDNIALMILDKYQSHKKSDQIHKYSKQPNDHYKNEEQLKSKKDLEEEINLLVTKREKEERKYQQQQQNNEQLEKIQAKYKDYYTSQIALKKQELQLLQSQVDKQKVELSQVRRQSYSFAS